MEENAWQETAKGLVTDDRVETYRKVYREVYNVDLDPAVAREQALRLLTVYRILAGMRPGGDP